MSINQISYANTFGEWVIATNQAISGLNSIEANNYTKSNGTLTISSPGVGLQVSNTANFNNINVSGRLVAQNANTTQIGLVQLNDTIISKSNTLAATANSVNTLNNLIVTNTQNINLAFNKANSSVRTGFPTIVANSTTINTTSNNDTLTITANSGISITGNNINKSIDIGFIPTITTNLNINKSTPTLNLFSSGISTNQGGKINFANNNNLRFQVEDFNVFTDANSSGLLFSRYNNAGNLVDRPFKINYTTGNVIVQNSLEIAENVKLIKPSTGNTDWQINHTNNNLSIDNYNLDGTLNNTVFNISNTGNLSIPNEIISDTTSSNTDSHLVLNNTIYTNGTISFRNLSGTEYTLWQLVNAANSKDFLIQRYINNIEQLPYPIQIAHSNGDVGINGIFSSYHQSIQAAANGYKIFPGGFILKWGATGVVSDSENPDFGKVTINLAGPQYQYFSYIFPVADADRIANIVSLNTGSNSWTLSLRNPIGSFTGLGNIFYFIIGF